MVDFGDIWEVFQVLAAQGGLGVIHSEDNDIVMHMYGKLIREGRTGFENMAEVHNTLSEDISFRRVIRLAEKVPGTALYMMHTSAASGVSAIREARARGVPIYGESLHQYMLYTNEDYKTPRGQIYHTYPSLKSKEDQAALWDGTLDGSINCVATDEICCTLAKKLQGARIDDTTGGNAGVEPRVALMYTEMVGRRGYSLTALRRSGVDQRGEDHGAVSAQGRAGGGRRCGYLRAGSGGPAGDPGRGPARGRLHAVGRPQDGRLALPDRAARQGRGGGRHVQRQPERRQVAAAQGRRGDAGGAAAVSAAYGGAGPHCGGCMTDAELRGLLTDSLVLWDIAGRVTAGEAGMQIATADGVFLLQRAPADLRPVRWLLQTPVRAAAGRPPRAAPSIVAALSALRNAIGGEGGSALRIGPTAG